MDFKGRYFPVLDHGFVALVDYMGKDADIVQAARVSYGAGTKKASEDRDLVRYLMNHEHTTPFEMCELKFHVKLPIFVARQLVRHRTASLNEYSLRYSLAPLMFYLPEYEVFRRQSASNRQGRGEQANRASYDRLAGLWKDLRAEASEVYRDALLEDIAREIARIDLPLSLYTEWYWKINLHNLFRFLKLRADSHAQEEIQVYARVKGALARELFPVAFEAFVDYSFEAIKLSRMERLAVAAHLAGKPNPVGGLGMTSREVVEFDRKMANLCETPQSWPVLSLESSYAAEHFLAEAQAHVPKLDKAAP